MREHGRISTGESAAWKISCSRHPRTFKALAASGSGCWLITSCCSGSEVDSLALPIFFFFDGLRITALH